MKRTEYLKPELEIVKGGEKDYRKLINKNIGFIEKQCKIFLYSRP